MSHMQRLAKYPPSTRISNVIAVTSLLDTNIMKLPPFLKATPLSSIASRVTTRTTLQFWRPFFSDYVPRDPKTKPKKYKYPAFYDPYGPRPPPSDKVIQLAERIVALPAEERKLIASALQSKLDLPKLEVVSSDGLNIGSQGGASAGSSKDEVKKVEKTAFDVKLEKFDAAAKIKVIKEVRAFTNLGLKEAKDLVEKAPVLLKQGVSKDEANDIIEKIKSAGGVAIME